MAGARGATAGGAVRWLELEGRRLEVLCDGWSSRMAGGEVRWLEVRCLLRGIGTCLRRLGCLRGVGTCLRRLRRLRGLGTYLRGLGCLRGISTCLRGLGCLRVLGTCLRGLADVSLQDGRPCERSSRLLQGGACFSRVPYVPLGPGEERCHRKKLRRRLGGHPTPGPSDRNSYLRRIVRSEALRALVAASAGGCALLTRTLLPEVSECLR